MSEKPAPVYLLAGDPFLCERKYEALVKLIQKSVTGETIIQSLHLSETPLDKILETARSLPFLAAAQILRIRNAESLKDKQCELLEQYLTHPSATAYLIFESSASAKDSALAASVSKRGEVYHLQNEERRGGASWVRDKLRRAEKSATPQALARLEEQAGDAPGFLDSVLDQLILYAGDRKEITEEMVESFEENWQSTDVFKLTDAIAGQKTADALILLKRILQEGGKDVFGLLGLLHWQMRRMWLAKTLLEEGAPESTIAKKCRLSFKQLPFVMRQLRGVSRAKLEKGIEGLFQLDWKLKSGRMDENLGLETWILQATA